MEIRYFSNGKVKLIRICNKKHIIQFRYLSCGCFFSLSRLNNFLIMDGISEWWQPNKTRSVIATYKYIKLKKHSWKCGMEICFLYDRN